MDYGRVLGVSSTGTLAVTGVNLGYGWHLLVGASIAVAAIAMIRTNFRKQS